nr:B-cell differentiation antigen CD72-like isoform X2 [Zootoca vivipara]
MSQGVTYADLRFVRTPPERSQEKESDRRTWYANLALLAACLCLLTTAIGLGVQYWQVSRQLQQANEDGSALARRIGSKEGSLAQAQVQLEEAKEELHSTNETLRSCWAAGNRTQEKLRQANESLMLTQQEKEKLQQQLDQTMKSLEEAKSCQEIGCCPHGWNLFRWKCLWISNNTKSWGDSWAACKRESSQLLVLKPWSAKQLWGATFIDKRTQYWIGLEGKWYKKWVDGTNYEGTENIGTCRSRGNCVQMSNRALQWCGCSTKARYICEKNAQ